jgi:hypothetical protein
VLARFGTFAPQVLEGMCFPEPWFVVFSDLRKASDLCADFYWAWYRGLLNPRAQSQLRVHQWEGEPQRAGFLDL